MMLPWAMLPDVVEFDALAHGERREGLLYALFTFGQKAAGSLGVFANALVAAGSATCRARPCRPPRPSPASAS